MIRILQTTWSETGLKSLEMVEIRSCLFNNFIVIIIPVQLLRPLQYTE